MRILLLGHNKWACLTLTALVKAGHEIVGVVTETDAFDREEAEVYERFARYGAYESLKEAALQVGLPLYQPKDINHTEFIATIDAMAPDLIICVSYHAILKRELISRYPARIINAHLAPLPHYRGRAPINWAIINGEDHTAVTVHFIDEGIDTGPIIVQERIPILEMDRAIDVLLRALPAFPRTILSAIRKIETDKVEALPQSPFDGSYFPKRTPKDGLIDWKYMNTQDIHNTIRALSDPYPGAFSYCKGEKIIFHRSQLPREMHRVSPIAGLVFTKIPDGAVKVTTRDSHITITSIQVGDREIRPAEYLKLGSKLSSESPITSPPWGSRQR